MDSLCAGESAPDSPSHCLFLAPEMRNESNGNRTKEHQASAWCLLSI